MFTKNDSSSVLLTQQCNINWKAIDQQKGAGQKRPILCHKEVPKKGFGNMFFKLPSSIPSHDNQSRELS